MTLQRISIVNQWSTIQGIRGLFNHYVISKLGSQKNDPYHDLNQQCQKALIPSLEQCKIT